MLLSGTGLCGESKEEMTEFLRLPERILIYFKRMGDAFSLLSVSTITGDDPSSWRSAVSTCGALRVRWHLT